MISVVDYCGQGKYPLISAVAKELGGYTPGPSDHSDGCEAIGPYKGNANMDEWCVKNCEIGNPSGHIMVKRHSNNVV